MTLTRIQVLDYVGDAFGRGPITTEEMRKVASRNGADPDILILLDELPARSFTSPREIWPYLPDLPVGV
jgi:hypothetical protein